MRKLVKSKRGLRGQQDWDQAGAAPRCHCCVSSQLGFPSGFFLQTKPKGGGCGPCSRDPAGTTWISRGPKDASLAVSGWGHQAAAVFCSCAAAGREGLESVRGYPMNKSVPRSRPAELLQTGLLMFAFHDCFCPEAALGQPRHQ